MSDWVEGFQDTVDNQWQNAGNYRFNMNQAYWDLLACVENHSKSNSEVSSYFEGRIAGHSYLRKMRVLQNKLAKERRGSEQVS